MMHPRSAAQAWLAVFLLIALRASVLPARRAKMAGKVARRADEGTPVGVNVVIVGTRLGGVIEY